MKKTFLLIAMLALAGAALFAAGNDVKVAVIVSAGSPLAKSLDAAGVKKIFTGKMLYIDGVLIVPLNRKDQDIYTMFLERFVGQTNSSYKNYWVKLVFAQGLEAPEIKDTAAEVISLVAENKAAIGYVTDAELKGSEKKVKVIAVK